MKAISDQILPHRVTVESRTAMIAASIPALRPLFKTFAESSAYDHRLSHRAAHFMSVKSDSEVTSEPNSPPPNLARKRSFVQRVRRGNNEYEHSIWNPQEESIKIQKTTDVFVSYERNSDVSV